MIVQNITDEWLYSSTEIQDTVKVPSETKVTSGRMICIGSNQENEITCIFFITRIQDNIIIPYELMHMYSFSSLEEHWLMYESDSTNNLP